ncbi:MAG TPA: hypothetical protein PKA33_14980 [Amaricoccus sp.]|uniref:hypothetical protein n=1 Tax=Amaricoccus sp. TaxID=1872485 RepID=UPI002BFDBE52|nr:hypothetical protein [Amaricoccus sp.]HMQ94663.1 hypothetical protein [Amaricoccus sp.]HMR53615.1 hypothetical protein [Amaricoccus sp.]HMR60783.1 hypothetical protein [Amaricoccus sp.]HMU00651.1 hypothetical protein [Amaricoccus sp.]
MKVEEGTDLANAGLDWRKVVELMNASVFAIRDEDVVRPPFRQAATQAEAQKRGEAS